MIVFKLNFLAMMLLQEVGFDLRSMWQQSSFIGKSVIVLLAIMSAWSIGVMIDRYLAFSQARKQSREFAPAVAGCLKEGKIEEAISVAEQNKPATWLKLSKPGCRNSVLTAFLMNLPESNWNLHAVPASALKPL